MATDPSNTTTIPGFDPFSLDDGGGGASQGGWHLSSMGWIPHDPASGGGDVDSGDDDFLKQRIFQPGSDAPWPGGDDGTAQPATLALGNVATPAPARTPVALGASTPAGGAGAGTGGGRGSAASGGSAYPADPVGGGNLAGMGDAFSKPYTMQLGGDGSPQGGYPDFTEPAPQPGRVAPASAPASTPGTASGNSSAADGGGWVYYDPSGNDDADMDRARDAFSSPYHLPLGNNVPPRGGQDGFGLNTKENRPTLPPNPKWAFDVPDWTWGSNGANNHNYNLDNTKRLDISMDTGTERPWPPSGVSYNNQPGRAQSGQPGAAYQGGPDSLTSYISSPGFNLPPIPPVIYHGQAAVDTDGSFTRDKYNDGNFAPQTPGKIDENGNITPAEYYTKERNYSNVNSNVDNYGVVPRGSKHGKGQFQLGDAETIMRDDNGINATVPVGDYGPVYSLIKEGKHKGEVATTGFGEMSTGTAQNKLYLPIKKTGHGPEPNGNFQVTTTIYPGSYPRPTLPAFSVPVPIRLSPYKK